MAGLSISVPETVAFDVATGLRQVPGEQGMDYRHLPAVRTHPESIPIDGTSFRLGIKKVTGRAGANHEFSV